MLLTQTSILSDQTYDQDNREYRNPKVLLTVDDEYSLMMLIIALLGKGALNLGNDTWGSSQSV